MLHRVGLRRWGALVVVVISLAPLSARLRAQTLSGTLHYSGTRGVVMDESPLRILADDNPFFSVSGIVLDGSTVAMNGGPFLLGPGTSGPFYLVYWLDLDADGQFGVGEPFTFYDQRFTLPADPITLPHADLPLELTDAALFSGIAGTATYTGAQGPVTTSRTICVCASTSPQLSPLIGCVPVTFNGGRYNFTTLDTRTYYLLVFLDSQHLNVQLDPGEPYQIYNQKSLAPGDLVTASGTQTDINFVFGDDFIFGTTPGPTWTPTAAATATETPSPPPPQCAGDCDGNGEVTISELLAMVNIALGNTGLDACVAGDADRDGTVTVTDIVAALRRLFEGCPA